MSAAIPIRHTSQLLQETGYVHGGVTELTPSSAAAGQPNIKTRRDKWQVKREIEKGYFYNPILHPYRPSPTQFNHTDYLDLVRSIIEHLALTGIVVSAPWLNEILRVEKSIRESRELIIQTHGLQAQETVRRLSLPPQKEGKPPIIVACQGKIPFCNGLACLGRMKTLPKLVYST